PAIIHGRRPDDKLLVTFDHRDIARVRRTPWFWNTVYDINVEGKGTFRVIPRCHQRHYMYYHNTVNVTFMKFEPFKKYLIQVPVLLENQEVCMGIKRGGLLSYNQDYYKCWWAGDENIPQKITIDIRNMDIGDVAHNRNIDIPPELLPHLPHHQYTFASITGGQSLESQSAMNEA
ncbi:hypothetical protein BVRB_034930, partial [Beta vulgaris subsp. vulgaris]